MSSNLKRNTRLPFLVQQERDELTVAEEWQSCPFTD